MRLVFDSLSAKPGLFVPISICDSLFPRMLYKRCHVLYSLCCSSHLIAPFFLLCYAYILSSILPTLGHVSQKSRRVVGPKLSPRLIHGARLSDQHDCALGPVYPENGITWRNRVMWYKVSTTHRVLQLLNSMRVWKKQREKRAVCIDFG